MSFGSFKFVNNIKFQQKQPVVALYQPMLGKCKRQNKSNRFNLKADGCFCLLLRAEAATRGVPWKKVFLEISQNSQENTYASLFFK